jgi:hypothetical protein
MSQQVRMRVVAPFLLMLLVFLIGFPVWMRSPQSFGGRLFAYVFGAMLVVLGIIGLIGGIAFRIFGFRLFRN